MHSDTPDTFRETARKHTGLRIEGMDICPNEASVDVGADIVASPARRFEMEIAIGVLHHELCESGLILEPGELDVFVKKDLAEHPQEALSGYLEILRGILGCKKPKRRWRPFGKSPPDQVPKWSMIGVEGVALGDEQITIHGIAKQIVNL